MLKYPKTSKDRVVSPKVIIFDLDGTLIDSVPDLAHAVNTILKEVKKAPFETETIRGWVGNGSQMLVKRALCGDVEAKEVIDQAFLNHCVTLFSDAYQKNVCVHTTLYPNVMTLLKNLKQKGFILSIVTNKTYRFVEPILKQLKIDTYFDYYLGGDSLSEKKPSPMPLIEVCNRFDITAKEALMVGDSKNDILAANAAGMDSVAVTYGYNYGEEIISYSPTFIVEDIADIESLVEKKKQKKVAVIGGGIAGSSAAIYLASRGVDVTLFEKRATLVDGPPMCHLHAGGNLYREISDAQCVRLLKESIELLRFYPYSIDFRPTVVVTPVTDAHDPRDLIPRLNLLQKEYEALIHLDEKNRVLGDPSEYFKVYEKEDLLHLSYDEESIDRWMIPVAKHSDLEKVKFPIILVQEYGINVFRIGASATLLLKGLDHAMIRPNTRVLEVQKNETYTITHEIEGKRETESFDFVINASGFLSGKIDDSLKVKRDRFVEFKAAYVTKWQNEEPFWPEIIFHGERGTPQGMGQFTPYYGGFFQLHAMTNDITLFSNGLVKNSSDSSQPELDGEFIEKIDAKWKEEEIKERTQKAITHLSQYIPTFQSAVTAAKPLYGAQQIPGSNETLRAAEVSFASDTYARCEIVKASSVFAMSDAIIKELQSLGFKVHEQQPLVKLDTERIDTLAQEIAESRGYPKEMGKVNFSF